MLENNGADVERIVVRRDKVGGDSSVHSHGQKENDPSHPPRNNDGLGLNMVQVHSSTSTKASHEQPITSSIKKGHKQSPARPIPPPKRAAGTGNIGGKMTPSSFHNRSTDKLQS